MCLKATKGPLSCKNLTFSIENSIKVQATLENLIHKFLWSSIIGNALDLEFKIHDMIMYYASVTIDDVSQSNNMHLGKGENSNPPTTKVMIDLGLVNSSQNRKIFYARVKSKIASQNM